MHRSIHLQRWAVVAFGLALALTECTDTDRFSVTSGGGASGGQAGAGGHAGGAGKGGAGGSGGTSVGGAGSGGAGSGGSCGVVGGSGGTSGCTELQSDDGDPCHFYRICGETKDWFAARSTCATWGGYLAAIGSANEGSELHTKAVQLGFASQTGFWVGLHRQRMYTNGLLANESTTTSTLDATWRWDGTGHNSTYTSWCATEPNDTHHMNAGPFPSCDDTDPTDGEECVLFNSCGSSGWNDAICCEPLPYICEHS